MGNHDMKIRAYLEAAAAAKRECMEDTCNIAGQLHGLIHYARLHQPIVNEHVRDLQHAGCMGAGVVMIVQVAILYFP